MVNRKSLNTFSLAANVLKYAKVNTIILNVTSN